MYLRSQVASRRTHGAGRCVRLQFMENANNKQYDATWMQHFKFTLLRVHSALSYTFRSHAPSIVATCNLLKNNQSTIFAANADATCTNQAEISMQPLVSLYSPSFPSYLPLSPSLSLSLPIVVGPTRIHTLSITISEQFIIYIKVLIFFLRFFVNWLLLALLFIYELNLTFALVIYFFSSPPDE